MLDPTTHVVVVLINVLLTVFYNVYIFSGIVSSMNRVLRNRRVPLANLLWYWTKWPALTYLLTDPIFAILVEGELALWRAFFDIAGLGVWWMTRNDGDDEDHKKLKKKVKDKVTQVQGKLVVVPQPA